MSIRWTMSFCGILPWASARYGRICNAFSAPSPSRAQVSPPASNLEELNHPDHLAELFAHRKYAASLLLDVKKTVI